MIQSGFYGTRFTANGCPSESVTEDIFVDILQFLASEYGAHPLGLARSYPAMSCDQVYTANPNSKSGQYWIINGDDVIYINCEFEF